MIIYPTLELLNHRCVSVTRGRLEAASIWHVDPLETARSWAEAGAEWMHLTDFDWVAGRDGNTDQVREIIRSVGIPVQLAGGFRTADAVAQWIELGAGRVVLSTLAVLDPDGVKALAKAYPDQIVISVDVLEGRVMTHGWQQQSAYEPETLIRAYNDAPLAAVIVTDIEPRDRAADGRLGLVSGLASIARAPVIASGVVSSEDDVARLKYIPNIAGAMVGRALFEKAVDLPSVLKLARPEVEPVADFI
ncbi:1-(5-phosphoribosyl)-5-[(5-phosphoribosylamino)methylideneamino] imidazole-4-carboxamide isomerase [Aliishimia ponticola]|uniref:1-(5-phosphoribosyl)-5-[(5-phosphoribosylamino)methylideneamino] imidazole-4-carboxamide isomerase n=1 Tax=Aliishimia ponticola TaxID=2499833 RepID=A0A4S4NQ17_9RHOB|nr:1-(5-phosphoribosyl)-5-[(5-phosphoribosylamino)methylideneamino] imidazole-4-carboxamide isomerase [Aliishimia ponticola]THH38300.1 1-(5-phosphoribosyl)-5-[(5-phosphoribosylamino)methylideneamino] imidazole-4-carboxamide isomerase [Aliishimia ponticola]